MKRIVSELIGRIRTEAWRQAQWPDPERIYRMSGLWGVAAYLQQSWDPILTKELLTRHGADIHPDAWPIGPGISLHDWGDSFANLHVGPYVHIGRECFLDLSESIVFEESVAIGMRSIVLTHMNIGHPFPNKPLRKLFPEKKRPVIFRRGCSIGAGCIIACGVEIGEDAMVNAGVTVDRDVPPRTIVTGPRTIERGMPERVFRDRSAG